eukprot:g37297.t1
MSIWEARTSQLRRRMQMSSHEALFAEALQGLEGSRYRRHRSRVYEGESLRRLAEQRAREAGEGEAGKREGFKSLSLRNNWQPTGENKESPSPKVNGDQECNQGKAYNRQAESRQSLTLDEPARLKRRYRSLYKEAKLGLEESDETNLSHNRASNSKEDGLPPPKEQEETGPPSHSPKEKGAPQVGAESARVAGSENPDSTRNSKIDKQQINEQTSLLNLQLDLKNTPASPRLTESASCNNRDQDKSRDQTEVDVDCENTETPMDSLVAP